MRVRVRSKCWSIVRLKDFRKESEESSPFDFWPKNYQ